ncbi:MAG TPA: hypothetical protein VD907_07110 [Verrucomicrobiae bacterium]|nr:hypothetical protein [Verrucomicrobiae bacterium]
MARVEELYEQAGVIHTHNPSCRVCTPIEGYKGITGIVITGVNSVSVVEADIKGTDDA